MNISDILFKKEAAWSDEDYRNTALNTVLPVGGAAVGYGLTNALADKASTGLKLTGAGMGATAGLLLSLYLQNMENETGVRASEAAEADIANSGAFSPFMKTVGVGGTLGTGALLGYMGLKGIQGAGERFKNFVANKATMPNVYSTVMNSGMKQEMNNAVNAAKNSTINWAKTRELLKTIKAVKK